MSTVPHCNMLQTKIRSPIIMLEAVVVYTLHLYWPKKKTSSTYTISIMHEAGYSPVPKAFPVTYATLCDH